MRKAGIPDQNRSEAEIKIVAKKRIDSMGFVVDLETTCHWVLWGIFTRAQGAPTVKHLRKHRRYLYGYEGIVENGIKGTSDKAAKMRISASLLLAYMRPCEYSLQMKNVKIEESFGDERGFTLSDRSMEAAKELEKFPLQFSMEYGLVTEMRPSLKERQNHILNIKRGILSALQINWSKTRRQDSETTVSGICDVNYKTARNSDGSRNISKTTDLASCKERTAVHSNIESEQYIKTSSIYEERSFCNYVVDKKHKMNKAECHEEYLVKPFSSLAGAGSYSTIKQTLKLLKIKKLFYNPTQYPETYTTSLLFGHEHEEEQSKSSSQTSVVDLLKELVKESSRKTQPSSANRFGELVFSMRKLDERALGGVIAQLSTCFQSPSCDRELVEAYTTYFFESLAQCGSTSCVRILASLIMTKKIPTEMVDGLISSLNFIQEPSTAMLNAIMGIHKITASPTALLSLGTLMHKLCKHRPDECIGNGPIASVVRNAEFYLMRLLGNECNTKDADKTNQMYYALKAIGNAGRPSRIKNIIMDCVRHAAHVNTSIAALHALNRMPVDGNIEGFFRELFSDKSIDMEKRIEAFLMLMRAPSDSDILLAVDMVNDVQEAKQLRSFISSFLQAVVSNQSPQKKRLTDLFRKTLLLRNMTAFNPTAARFSKAFEKSAFLDVAGIGGSVNGKLLFHPESYIPRTVRFGLDSQALGHSINVVEVNARMEGIEQGVGKIMSNSFMKNAFNIPNLKTEDQAKRRNRRSNLEDEFKNKLEDLDDEVNLKQASPQLALSFKIFGNEVRMLSLKDIPVLNGELDNMNIIQALYSLTKGHSKTYRQSLVFMEGKYVVPTILGLPLSFELNGTAVVSVNLEGKISAKNLLFGAKVLNLKGSILPSVSTEISGKVTVDGFFSKAGMRFNARTHASARLSGEIRYEEGKEFKVDIDAPKEPVDLFSYKHEIFHVVGSQEVAMQGSKRRTALNICSDELYPSTGIFGVDLCTAMSFPVAFHDLDAPYYPLTGPANVSFQLKRTDLSLSKYHLSVKKNNDLYQIKFGTPGAQNERWRVLNLGITANSQMGVVGATFGNSKRGYDNKTHGVQASLTSNITQNEVTISAKYYNKTDPASLDLKMGLELDIKSGEINLNHKLLFVDTYEYWGFDWSVDYGQPLIKAELKVAYNPQTVFFKFQHGRQNFAVHLQPSFPVIVLDLGLNWYPLVSNFSLNLDLKNAIFGVVANTTSHSYAGRLEWKKGSKEQQLLVNFGRGEQIYKWITQVSYKNETKTVESYLAGRGKKFGARLVMRNPGITLSLHGYPATFQARLLQDVRAKGVMLRASVGRMTGVLKLHYKETPSDRKRSVCLTATAAQYNAGLCMDVVLKDEQKSVQVRIDSPKGKMSTLLTFTTPKASSQYLGTPGNEYIDLNSRFNGRTLFEARCVSERSPKNPSVRRLSSLTWKANGANVQLDFKWPVPDVKNGQVKESGWFVFRRKVDEEEQLFEIRRSGHGTLSAKNMDITSTTSYVFSNKKKDSVFFIGFSEQQKFSGHGDDISAVREFALLNNKFVSQSTEKFSVMKGNYAWDNSYKTANASVAKSIPNPSLSTIKNGMKAVSPYLQLRGKVLRMPNGSQKYYPSEIQVDAFGNKAQYVADMKQKQSKLSIVLSTGKRVDLGVHFQIGQRYVFTADYRNATWVIKRLTVTISKISGSWQIKIQHPGLRMLIGSLRMRFESGKERIKAELTRKLTNMMAKADIDPVVRNELLRDVGVFYGLDFIKANLSGLLNNMDQKWSGIMKNVVQRRVESALNEGLKRVAKAVKGKLSYLPDGIFKKLSADASKMLADILLFKTDMAVKKGEQIAQYLKQHAKDYLSGPAFKDAVKTSLKNALKKQQISSEASNKIMVIFEKGFGSVVQNPWSVMQLYRNVTDAVMKERLQIQRKALKTGLTRLLKLFRAHVSKYSDAKLKTGLSRLFDEIEKISSQRFDDLKPSQMLRKIAGIFENFSISEDELRKIAFGVVSEELKKSGIPQPVTQAVMKFARQLNYEGFYYDVINYCMKAAGLTNSMYSDFAKKLYKNDLKGLIEIAELAVDDRNLPREVRTVFQNYLQSFKVYDLIVGLLRVGFGKMNESDVLTSKLATHLAGKNLTGLAKELAQFGVSKLPLPKEAKHVLQEIAFGPKNRGFLQRALKVVSVAANSSNDGILRALMPHDKMAAFVKTLYNELVAQMKLNPEFQGLLQKFGDDFNITGLLDKAVKLSTRHLYSAMNVSKGEGLGSSAKLIILKYVSQGFRMVPDLWKRRFAPIFGLLIKELRETKPEDLARNTTEVLFAVGEKVMKVVQFYVANNLAADLEKDAMRLFETFSGKLALGNVSLKDLFQRLKLEAKSKLMFGLRLASQVFPEQVKQYTRKYTKGNTILYSKMYSDFLKTNLTSRQYTGTLEKMFSGLASRVIAEVTNATAGFSTGTGFLNMLKFVGGLNFTDGSSVLTSYEKMKNMKYTKWSVHALHQHLKAVLRKVGQWNIGNQTIDEHATPMILGFRTILPKLITANDNFRKWSDRILTKAFAIIKQTQAKFKTDITSSIDKVVRGFRKWRKVLTFASDLTIPIVNNVPRMFDTKKFDFTLLKVFVNPIFRLGLVDDLQNLVRRTSETPIDTSLKVILLKTSKAFELITQNLIVKRISFAKDILMNIQSEVSNTLSTFDSFLNHKADQPLYKVVNKAGKHGYGFVKSRIASSTLGQKIRQELLPLYNMSSLTTSIRSQLKRFSTLVKNAFQSLDQKAVQQWAKRNVPDVVNKATLGATKSIVDHLRLMDKVRSFMLHNVFFKNPAAYVRGIPKKTMLLLSKRMANARPHIKAWFVAIENALRSKITQARHVYVEYLGKAQALVRKANLQLKNMDYYSSLLEVMNKYGWQKHLSNQTSEMSRKLESVNKMLVQQLKHFSESDSLESLVSKLRNSTKGWLSDFKSALGKSRFTMKEGLNKGLVELEKYEQSMAGFDREFQGNMSEILGDAKRLTKNITQTIATILKDVNAKIGTERNAVLKDIMKTLKSVQANATRIKQEMRKYISLVDDSILIINVPNTLFERVKKFYGLGRKRLSEHVTVIQPQKHKYRKTEYKSTSKSLGYKPISSEVVSVSSTTSAEVVYTNVTLPADRPKQIFPGLILLRNIKSWQPYFDRGFGMVNNVITSFNGLLLNSTVRYRISKSQLDAAMDRLLVGLYNRRVLAPLKRLAVAASIPPPAESLKALGKGEGHWKKYTKMLTPSTGSATLYGNHVLTFDGNYVFIPDLKASCTYLLARDFLGGNFTLLYDLQRLTLKTRDGTIYFKRNGVIEIEDFSKDTASGIAELPAQVGSMIIKRFDQIVRLESRAGFLLYCHMDLFLCNFTISGAYHNKTLGLFGTNNMEYADDLRLPDGSLAIDLIEFIQSWELSEKDACRSVSSYDFIPNCRRPSSDRCNALFKHKSSIFSKAFDNVNPTPYLLACEYETSKCLSRNERPSSHCTTAAAYVNMALQTGIPIKHPTDCGVCTWRNGKPVTSGQVVYHKDLRSVDVILIIRDSKTMKNALKNLILTMRNVDNRLKSSQFDMRYWVVGFDGLGHRVQPYIQTGLGVASGNIHHLTRALNNLELKNTRKIVSGLKAISFAAKLDMRSTSTKIFMIVDSVAVYSGALKEMMDTNNLLTQKSIILNSFNRYKFKRNIIGKDSFNRRYHLKIPKGERLRSLAIGTADDYMPIVKESRGAVMTVKALLSSNEKWMKAFPVSLVEVLHRQVTFDKSHCKKCHCALNKEGQGSFVCIRADRRLEEEASGCWEKIVGSEDNLGQLIRKAAWLSHFCSSATEAIHIGYLQLIAFQEIFLKNRLMDGSNFEFDGAAYKWEMTQTLERMLNKWECYEQLKNKELYIELGTIIILNSMLKDGPAERGLSCCCCYHREKKNEKEASGWFEKKILESGDNLGQLIGKPLLGKLWFLATEAIGFPQMVSKQKIARRVKDMSNRPMDW
eukprot:gene9953-10973_t